MIRISRKFAKLFTIILLALISLIFYFISRTTPQLNLQPNVLPAQTEKTYYTVTKVVDGDTIDVTLNGVTERVRLIGIDTPETVDPRKPLQCFGKEASDKAGQILQNKEVELKDDPTQADKDSFGRLLRYVFLKDGLFFNKYMIEEGYAFEYTYRTPYKYQQEFRDAQKYAEENKRGLWAENACPTL